MLDSATFEQAEIISRMMERTPARICVGRAGVRLRTETQLRLRVDHAMAQDAVFGEVDTTLLAEMKLFSVDTKCRDKKEYITRPDLGRQLSDKALAEMKSRCKSGSDVQIIVSDGLSSKAVEANLQRILPVLEDGLLLAGLKLGTSFFVRMGRVAVEDVVAELLDAKVVCMLIGERPGLSTAESMSAYICYNAKVGQPESRRMVVSNIHKGGTAAAEAGAYIVELIQKILTAKASGIELKQ